VQSTAGTTASVCTDLALPIESRMISWMLVRD
jgi:hypothetical protein